jgi:hypothetical protein
MASNKNDMLNTRTVSGSVNLYDDQKCIGNAEDKTIAAMLGGHSFNIVNHREELYFPNLRHDSHFVDRSNVATMHWMDRKRKYPRDPRNHMKMALQNPAEHPKVAEREQRRQEYRISQMENSQSYKDFQDRRRLMRPESPEARRTLNPTNKPPSAMRVTECKPIPKDTFLQRREQYAQSVPNLRSESLHKLQQSRPSLQRAENYDFAITRKNNSWSAEDKLIRSDPYYMKPKLAITNNSVKYDILTNERKNFWY